MFVAATPERLRLMIELAAWRALRFGEVAELRRGDVYLRNGEIRVSRAVQWVDGKRIVAAPKADSGRVVPFPPHIGEAIKEHLTKHAQWGKDGLLARPRAATVLAPPFHHAYFREEREAAGRSELRSHDLRHTGATTLAGCARCHAGRVDAAAGPLDRLGSVILVSTLRRADKRIAAQLSVMAMG